MRLVCVGWILLLAAEVNAAPAKPDSAYDRQQYSYRLGVARTAYFRVITNGNEDSSKQAHAALSELEQAYPGDPVAKAYHGSLQLLDVAHSWAIWNLRKQTTDGLAMLDEAVNQAPDEPEARFIRAATSWHLPGFLHRRAQSEADFELLAGQAERDVRDGRLTPELAAATLNYWGQILVSRKDVSGARAAFSAAIRVAPQSPGAVDAGKRLGQLQ
jgi:hypothetical protein